MEWGAWSAGVPAVAAAVAVMAWSLSGWTRDEVAESAAWVRARTEALVAAARSIAERVQAAFGADDAPSVSLADATEMIDVIRLGLSAGLSFDAALGLYCERRDGALGTRMAQARMAWQAGISTRDEELHAVARDLGVRELESFATVVGQALGLGAPLAETLANQSREMRAAHRTEVERRIERAPVKMIIPTGTLILPALLLSIVGPLLAAGGMI